MGDGMGDRILEILRHLIEGAELDRHGAAKVAAVQLAAADRYLKALEHHIPGVESRRAGKKRRYRFDRSELIEPPEPGHAIAACLAASLAPLFKGTDYETSLRDVLGLLVQRARERTEYKHIDRKFLFVQRGGEAMLPELAGELHDVVEATLGSEYLQVQWRGFKGDVRRARVQPLSLAIYQHQLYLVARKTENEDPFLIRFSRVEDVLREDETFNYPRLTQYDPEERFGQSIGVFISDDFPVETVVVRLTADWQLYTETHRWHPSQRVRIDDDGRVCVELRARICPELKSWVRGFGPDAEVLSPDSLRTEIRDEVHQLSLLYQVGTE
ncbi:MAG: WYL domain-containing protein [Proteobacteria bacterium]|nr:WYL domain-containing protein [Pseudomonadota bacterium]